LSPEGKISERTTIAEDADLPVPPGYFHSRRERQNTLDMIAYDRLRVLTTELRRLLAQGRSVKLRFNPRGTLTGRSLSRLIERI